MKRSPLRSVGRKRRSKQAQRAALVQRVLARDNYQCQFWAFTTVRLRPGYQITLTRKELDAIPERCDGPLDVHEIIPRSAWPDGELVDNNTVTVCRSHHQWIDWHPHYAHQLGLHGYSHERPTQ